MTKIHSRLLFVSFLTFSTLWAQAQSIRFVQGKDVVEVEAVSENVIRVHIEPDGVVTARTLVIDPAFVPAKTSSASASRDGRSITSSMFSASFSGDPVSALEIKNAGGVTLLRIPDLLANSRVGRIALEHDKSETLYGMRGLTLEDTGAGLERTGGAVIAAGVQGDGGAPFFFTKRYGVLVDSDGGAFEPLDKTIQFRNSSRTDVEFFIILGKPLEVMSGLARLAGKPPMPPKWTLGFLNSQWGSTEAELREVAETYAQKDIPISGFILDFDWKAWGEDNYGEWRWNSTSGPGNAFANKFPNGASGKFASDLLRQQIHLVGILKPRILVNREDGKPTEASAYATAHNFWLPQEHRENDYATNRLAGNIDFSNPDARKWYWDHLVPAFQAGITGWWNDEADGFNNLQFMNMGRALYEGQRQISQERVWSINRSYYLGASRYGYAEWSGDISAGFPSMAYQRRRMLATLDLGVQHWGMDTGGFVGNPTPENYARWMEFAAFVPIDRVHGGIGAKRQPWVFGPVAEAAAKHAIRLRYDMMPYIYSNERAATETGIGIVRPLFWEFPEDAASSNETRAWMFGDALLVSPIVESDATSHTFYLPPGTWFDYNTGKRLSGGRELQVTADSKTWMDIPIYIRDGSILATQVSGKDNNLDSGSPITLDIFPSSTRKAEFTVYDDDGHTYAYEHAEYFRQQIVAEQLKAKIMISLETPTGSYQSSIPGYLLRVHTRAAHIASNGIALKKFNSEASFLASKDAGWTRTYDRFGPVMLIRVENGVHGGGKLILH